MHLAYVTTEERGATDQLLSAFAQSLLARGTAIAGVVQTNTECEAGPGCDMDLTVLPDGPLIRISQSLGPHSRGCRLDSAALEQAVHAVTAALETSPVLLIINKFGKHEVDGRGFREVIGEALARDIPVLVGVNGLNEARFQAFAGDAARPLDATPEALEAWFSEIRLAVADRV